MHVESPNAFAIIHGKIKYVLYIMLLETYVLLRNFEKSVSLSIFPFPHRLCQLLPVHLAK